MQLSCVMQLHYFSGCAILCLLMFHDKCLAYKIPNVDFEMLNERGFEVSIPDEPGMQRVFYLFQIDESCPALMDYITEPLSGNWVSKQKFSLQNNDKIQISVLVQYNDEIYEKSETRVILNARLLTTRDTKSQSISHPPDEGICQAYFNGEQETKPCKQAQTIARQGQRVCQGDLLFEDTFNTAELNRTTWKHDIRQRMYHVEEELVAFDDAQKNSYVREGQLHIVPTIATEVTEGSFKLGDRCTAIDSPEQECSISQGSFYTIKPPVYSAQLHTRNSFSFKYGKIIVRAKLPKGDWLFPYIMLQPISTHAESHYAKQLRIAYARGNAHLRSIQQEDISGNHLYGGMIVWHHGRAVQFLKERLSNVHYGDDFHNYTMIWNRDKITLMVDDEVYGELYDGLPFFNEKCFIIFGVTVGGFLNFDDNILPRDVKPYKNREPRAALAFWQHRDTWEPTWGKHSAMVIDHVRVYAE
ncbi:gram-negative bacteria-binding protein 2-like [Scaptodrosophila lebanonensis]|uniref:Gram-negative bacteria-binding protein 2-like n=1 Tax=Drosophila lebanonensis TaxID=7225 RepID=A0A6J2TMR9_DROLE|nr:gram-negative bacteria-binding protein 2-like [Scaptodrosophila lebanonensis]